MACHYWRSYFVAVGGGGGGGGGAVGGGGVVVVFLMLEVYLVVEWGDEGRRTRSVSYGGDFGFGYDINSAEIWCSF